MPRRYRRNCDTCGKPYYGVGAFFCSIFCRRHTPETIEKIRLTNLGQKRSKEACINVGNAARGRFPSIVTRQKMRESRLKRPPASAETREKIRKLHLGEKSHFWRGGITNLNKKIRNSLEYRLWRGKIFKRDDYTCKICNKRGCELVVDHIKPLSAIIKDENIKNLDDISPQSQLWDTQNGRTLCFPCHKDTETYLNGAKNWKSENKLALM